MFHLLTQNMIKAFKFRAQAIFSLSEMTHTPLFYIIYIKNWILIAVLRN